MWIGCKQTYATQTIPSINYDEINVTEGQEFSTFCHFDTVTFWTESTFKKAWDSVTVFYYKFFKS